MENSKNTVKNTENPTIEVVGKVNYSKTRRSDENSFKSLGISLPEETKKSLESLFEDFKENTTEIPNGGIRFGAVAFDSDGKLYISGSSPQMMSSDKSDKVSFQVKLCIKGESYGEGNYSKTHLRIEYFENTSYKEVVSKQKAQIREKAALVAAAAEMGIKLDISHLLGAGTSTPNPKVESSDKKELED